MKGRYVTVSSGTELLDQLANSSARYIGVASDLSLPANLGMRRVVVSRCVADLVGWCPATLEHAPLCCMLVQHPASASEWIWSARRNTRIRQGCNWLPGVAPIASVGPWSS